MLYNETAVKANVRNRDGKRVFYLGVGDSLTPSARDWLAGQRIEILPADKAKPNVYQLENRETLTEKPEYMTHLRWNILVPKSSPIIAFRGAIDTLQAEILLAQPVVDSKTRKDLEEILTLARNILRWEVMEEKADFDRLCGLTGDELRTHSHRPQDFYNQPHFMPSCKDDPAVLQLNKVRCAARNAELAAARAFDDGNGGCVRPDLLTALNRLSSAVYILMIQIKAKGADYG